MSRSLNRATAASAAPRAGAAATRASTDGTGCPARPSPSTGSAPNSSVRAGTARWSGTKRSVTRIVLLPVARMPEVNHTSSTSTSDRGTTRNIVVNVGSVWIACTSTQSGWATPVAHSQRPVRRKPPCSTTTVPVGASGTGASAIGPSAKIAAPSAGGELRQQPAVHHQERESPCRGRAPVGHHPRALRQRLQAEATAAQRRGHERLEQAGFPAPRGGWRPEADGALQPPTPAPAGPGPRPRSAETNSGPSMVGDIDTHLRSPADRIGRGHPRSGRRERQPQTLASCEPLTTTTRT